jgi:hypothetical protein
LTQQTLPALQGRQRDHGVAVVWRAAIHRVDPVRLDLQHLAEILVAPGLGPAIVGLLRVDVIQIAEGDDLKTLLLAGLHLAEAHAADADGGQVDLLAGRRLAGAAEHVTWDYRSGGNSRGSLEQIATTDRQRT